MRGKLSRMWRSSLSLMLVFCMLVSMAPAAFATDSGTEPTTIKYVSLGDSVSLGSGSYPNLFADWLKAEGYADDVDHTALAKAAMRAEDLHFILTYSGANSAVAEGEWNEAAWNNAFSAGDYYTWKNFTSNGIITKEIAQQYQAAVAAADLLTVGIGNANFGDFLMDCAMDAVNGDLAWVNVETAMNGINATLKAELMDVYNKLLAKLEAEVGNDMAAPLANAMVYTMVGYVLNYQAVLDDIVGLNPDAEVIIVPLINTMDGIQITYNGSTYNLGGYLAEGLKVLNAYLAALPAAMQAVGQYPDAVFYYAEVGAVALQGNVAGSLTRADILETVVGENGDGIIWEMMADRVGGVYEGAALVAISAEQIKAYEDMDDAAKAKYAYDHTNEAISIALYLAFEKAIEASYGKVLSVEGLQAMGSINEVIDDVMDAFNANLETAGDQYEDEAYTVIAELVNDELEAELAKKDIAYEATLSDEDIKTLLGDDSAALIQELAFDIAAAGINTELGTDLTVAEIEALYREEAEQALMDDLVYAAVAKKVTESTDPDIQKYKSHFDTAEKVEALFVGGDSYVFGKAIELAKEELIETLGKEVSNAQIEALYGGDKNKINEQYPGLLEDLSKEAAYVEAAEELTTETGDEWTAADVKELANYTAQDVYQKVADNTDGKLDIEEVSKLHNDQDGSYAESKAYQLVAEEAEIELAELVALVDGDATVIAEKAVKEGKVETEAEFLELFNLDTTSADAVLNYMVANADEETTYEELKELYDAQDPDFMEAYNEVVTAHADAVQFVTDKQNEAVDAINTAKEELQKVVDTCNDIFDAQTELNNTINNEMDRIQNELIEEVQNGVDTAVNKLNTEVIGKKGEAETEIINTIKSKIDEEALPTLNDTVVPEIKKTVNEKMDDLCKLLGVSDALTGALNSNTTLSGLLNIMARCLIGDGLGMLPTANGHNTIAVAVETSYKTNHTVQDETKENVELALDKVIEILEENGMMIVDKATIKNALEYITDLDAAVAVLKGALQDQIDDYKNGVVPALQGDLAALQKLLSELEDKLEALENKLASLEAKLNDIRNTPDAAASTIEALEKAIAETNAAIASTREKIAYINTCIGALNEKLTQMSATLDELQAAIVQMETAVKGLYNAVSTKDISFHDAFNNLEALHASAIEAIYAVEDLYHELKDLGKDTIKFIDTVKDEAKTAVKLLGGSLYAAYKLLPNSVEAKIEAEAEAKIADLKAQIAEKKAQLEQEVKEDVKAELQKQIDALEAEIDAVKAKLADDIEKLNVNPDAVKLIEDVLKDTYDAIYAEYENVTGALKIEIDTKNEVIEASAQAIKNLIKFAEEEIDKVVEEAKAIYADVLNADYTITDSSYYVALGDASAYSASGSYVDILAADPQLALEEAYKNAYDTRTIDEMLADIRGGDVAPEVKTADLITVRFDNSQIVKNAFIHAFTYMKGADVVYTFEWEELIGAKGVQAVNNFLTALEAKLEEYGMEDMKLVEMADGSSLPAEGRTLDKAFVHMAESYLYYSIQYMLSIPEYVAEIHEINPDAVIVFVGMSNPFGNTVLTHENLNIEVGNYVGTIVKYVDMIGKGFCMLFPNATYVSAQEVETNASNVEMDLTQFFMNYVQDQNSTLYPTAAGHTYIKEQILKALTITDLRDCEHVAGDPVKENEVPATCTVAGSYDQVIYCTVCGEEMNRETVTVPATGHEDTDGDGYCDNPNCNEFIGETGTNYLMGDVNLDGRVTVTDLNMLYRYVGRDTTLAAFNNVQLILVDINLDGRVTVTDLNMLYRYIGRDSTLNWVPYEITIK